MIGAESSFSMEYPGHSSMWLQLVERRGFQLGQQFKSAAPEQQGIGDV